jgi:ABC-type ATPase with predicted acetyltransferase domain
MLPSLTPVLLLLLLLLLHSFYPTLQRNAQFKHHGKENFTLNVPEFSVQPGELVAVVGRVGAGKSSLIHAILGNMNPVQGRCETGGRVSYVPQNPWCQNLTLRDNICFGLPFEEERYERVSGRDCAVTACLSLLFSGCVALLSCCVALQMLHYLHSVDQQL